MPTDPRVDAYIDRQAEFAKPILTWIRERIHAACPQVEETIKWSMPAFVYAGKPLAGMGAFKAHATLGFWNREDTRTGKEGEAMGQYGRIESMADLPDAATVEAHVRTAMALVDSGAKTKRAAPGRKPEAEVPPELAEALSADDKAAETFNAFPPSCRREYCEWIAEAKRPETRARRVVEAIAWMREGKRRNWRYETC